MKRNLVVVGSVNLDLVVQAHHIPVPGETITGTGFAEFEGGKGANQAVGVARLGYPVVMLGHVGSDSFGERLERALREAGVNTEWMEPVPGSSGIALITHGSDGANNIVLVPGANGQVSTAYLEHHRTQILGAGMILCQLEIPIETVEALAKIAEAASIPFVLDPAPARPLGDSLLRTVTWLTPNETEAAILLGRKPNEGSPEEIAAALLAMGPRNVVLKLGERGVFVAGKDTASQLIPTLKVDVVDTTAAGDTFNAAFAVRLMRGDSPADAARYANAAAALSVTRMGAQPSMPSADEVDAILTSSRTAASTSKAG